MKSKSIELIYPSSHPYDDIDRGIIEVMKKYACNLEMRKIYHEKGEGPYDEPGRMKMFFVCPIASKDGIDKIETSLLGYFENTHPEIGYKWEKDGSFHFHGIDIMYNTHGHPSGYIITLHKTPPSGIPDYAKEFKLSAEPCDFSDLKHGDLIKFKEADSPYDYFLAMVDKVVDDRLYASMCAVRAGVTVQDALETITDYFNEGEISSAPLLLEDCVSIERVETVPEYAPEFILSASGLHLVNLGDDESKCPGCGKPTEHGKRPLGLMILGDIGRDARGVATHVECKHCGWKGMEYRVKGKFEAWLKYEHDKPDPTIPEYTKEFKLHASDEDDVNLIVKNIEELINNEYKFTQVEKETWVEEDSEDDEFITDIEWWFDPGGETILNKDIQKEIEDDIINNINTTVSNIIGKPAAVVEARDYLTAVDDYSIGITIFSSIVMNNMTIPQYTPEFKLHSPADDDDTMQSLTEYLTMLSDFRKDHTPEGWVYGSGEEFVLKNGQPFKSIPVPADLKCGEMKMCFQNATQAAGYAGYRYAEGYALQPGLIPTNHAWLIDENDNAIDLTWKYNPDTAYYGIIFDTDYLWKVLAEKETYGIIDNWTMGFPLLQGAEYYSAPLFTYGDRALEHTTDIAPYYADLERWSNVKKLVYDGEKVDLYTINSQNPVSIQFKGEIEWTKYGSRFVQEIKPFDIGHEIIFREPITVTLIVPFELDDDYGIEQNRILIEGDLSKVKIDSFAPEFTL